MAALKQLEAMNERLLAHQHKLSRVCEALEALRVVADRLVAEIEDDRALVVDLVVSRDSEEALSQDATLPALGTADPAPAAKMHALPCTPTEHATATASTAAAAAAAHETVAQHEPQCGSTAAFDPTL